MKGVKMKINFIFILLTIIVQSAPALADVSCAEDKEAVLRKYYIVAEAMHDFQYNTKVKVKEEFFKCDLKNPSQKEKRATDDLFSGTRLGGKRGKLS